MASMRQRLLLAAGWIVAAVGSGVVASGAVAIAGGQVLDRPLRPLTAAEVAALPVVSSGGIQRTGPLASGGTDSRSRVPPDDGSADDRATDPVDADSAGPGGAPTPRVLSPARGGEVFVTTIDDEPSTPTAPISGRTQSAIVLFPGGAASIYSGADGLELLWARPNAGFVVSLRFDEEHRLSLSFAGAATRYVMQATAGDDGLEITTSEETIL
jgi:hypothetical protein